MAECVFRHKKAYIFFVQELKKCLLCCSLLAIAWGVVSCKQDEPAKPVPAPAAKAEKASIPEKKVKSIPFPVPLVYRDNSAFSPAMADTAASSSSEEVPESSSAEIKSSAGVKSSAAKTQALVESSSSAPPAPAFCEDAPEEMICDKRDGHLYRQVRIGGQVWMAQNLNYKADGSFCYENKPQNCKVYGRLYTWVSAMGLPSSYAISSAAEVIEKEHRGACPEGFHMPKDNDMKALLSYIRKHNRYEKENSGTLLKMAFSWKYSEEWPTGTDRYGFGAMASGFRNAQGVFKELGRDADFWVAEESNSPSHAPYWNLYYDNDEFLGDYSKKKSYAYSVRCLKDKTTDEKPQATPEPQLENDPAAVDSTKKAK